MQFRHVIGSGGRVELYIDDLLALQDIEAMYGVQMARVQSGVGLQAQRFLVDTVIARATQIGPSAMLRRRRDGDRKYRTALV